MIPQAGGKLCASTTEWSCGEKGGSAGLPTWPWCCHIFSQVVDIWNWHILVGLSRMIKPIKSSPDIFLFPCCFRHCSTDLLFSLSSPYFKGKETQKSFFLLSKLCPCLKYWKTFSGAKMTIKSATSSATSTFYFIFKREILTKKKKKKMGRCVW